MSKILTPVEEMLENDWDAQLFRNRDALAKLTGWSSYHTLRSRGSKAGYPDRTLWRERVLFVETKRERKHSSPISAAQRKVLDELARAGAEVYLWRPLDLDEIAKILSSRWVFRRETFSDGEPKIRPRLERENGMDSWTPGSLWIPGQGRFDGDVR